jgi:hypothetical protein
MSQTITSRRPVRTVVAGALAVAVAAGFNSAARSTGGAEPSSPARMVPAVYRKTAGAGRRTSAAAPRRPLGSATGQNQRRLQAIADASGWDWRSAGVSYVAAFHPEACCHWGVYDPRDGRAYIGPSAFASAERLRYVVLHETAHAWQFRAGPTKALMGDYARWGYRGTAALEAGADCIAALWGASRDQGHYWHCPDAALAVAARELGR